ncbi:MAG: DUF2288 domain-containing protein [Cellvibrionaceae bacterium]
MSQDDNNIQDEELFQKINRETAKISWEELQPHYESGALVYVEPSIDLVKVAIEFSKDNKDQVEKWLTSGSIFRTTEEQAESWNSNNQDFWASVIAPWILIQPVK